MSFTELFLVGVGLSMDAFAVAICKGLKMPRIKYSQLFLIALFFGGFQALMPFIGWAIGSRFEKYIVNFDHWIAFLLLGFIGGNMIRESFKNDDDDDSDKFDIKELFILAVATSIDALAVGITFALLPSVDITAAVSIIGITTFVFSGIGVLIGHFFGAAYKNKAEFAGGVILVLMGLKILLEHLGVINF